MTGVPDRGEGRKPRILDLFCGAGGAAMGYARAGFEVVGVDIAPQPNYPFEFEQMDALWFLRDMLKFPHHFDAIHASPPCQAHTRANGGWKGRLPDNRHSELIVPTRELLESTGLPYVIENVVGAPLLDPVTICGTTLGLNVKRHRLFESIFPLMVPPCSGHERNYVICFGGGVRGRAHQLGRTPNNSGPILRRSTLPLEVGQKAMGIDWMDRHELSQAIPPAARNLEPQVRALGPAQRAPRRIATGLYGLMVLALTLAGESKAGAPRATRSYRVDRTPGVDSRSRFGKSCLRVIVRVLPCLSCVVAPPYNGRWTTSQKCKGRPSDRPPPRTTRSASSAQQHRPSYRGEWTMFAFYGRRRMSWLQCLRRTMRPPS